MTQNSVINIQNVNHYYGRGLLRQQILFNINLTVKLGEIVILAGPSGSGKTTLLTLIGGLRSVQEGSLKVFDRELCRATNKQLLQLRSQLGYIFQDHNLVPFFTAFQNVEMSLKLNKHLSKEKIRKKAETILEEVGLKDQVNRYSNQLSGGQKQRVAIARALVTQPRIVLADEPTASLDKNTGRDVVEIMQRLAKQQGCTIILVTHDNRILDIADRIISLEDGRLSASKGELLLNISTLMSAISETDRDQMEELMETLSIQQFSNFLDKLNKEFQQLLSTINMLTDRSLNDKIEIIIQTISFKIARILQAQQVTFFVVDKENDRLWSKNARGPGGELISIEIPLNVGIAGYVATTGETVNIPDPYKDPRFNPQVDRDTGFRTRNILCLPIFNSQKEVFAVVQLLNKAGDVPFDADDEQKFFELTQSLGFILETSILDMQNMQKNKNKRILGKIYSQLIDE
ncbi:MAG: ATP-binding cassette domain-containing protein [Xenococcaceae cyanobacterium]